MLAFALRLKYLQYLLQDWLLSYSQNGTNIDLHISPQHSCRAIAVLKAHVYTHMDVLSDIVGLDGRLLHQKHDLANAGTSGYKLIYTLLSIKNNARLNVHVLAPKNLNIDSVSSIYASSVWFEREVWDMLGIHFTGNPDMRRLLSDYQFIGHALRKDYPLVGYLEVFFYDAESRVVYLPINLTQEAKQFRTAKTWVL